MQVWGLTEMAGVRKECQGSYTLTKETSQREQQVADWVEECLKNKFLYGFHAKQSGTPGQVRSPQRVCLFKVTHC